MISNTKKFLTGMVIALVFASCTPRLAGSWAVQRYENSRPGQKGVSLNNIGTIRFYKNGKGEKNVNYTVLGINHKDQNPFRWTSTDANDIRNGMKILTCKSSAPGFYIQQAAF